MGASERVSPAYGYDILPVTHHSDRHADAVLHIFYRLSDPPPATQDRISECLKYRVSRYGNPERPRPPTICGDARAEKMRPGSRTFGRWPYDGHTE